MPRSRFKKGDVVEVNAEWCSLNGHYESINEVGPFGLVLDDVTSGGVFVPVLVLGEIRYYTFSEIELVDVTSENLKRRRKDDD